MDRVLESFSLTPDLTHNECSSQQPRHLLGQPLETFNNQSIQFADTTFRTLFAKTGPTIISSPQSSCLVLQSWTSQNKSNSISIWNLMEMIAAHHLAYRYVIPKRRWPLMGTLTEVKQDRHSLLWSLCTTEAFSFVAKPCLSINSNWVYHLWRFLSRLWVWPVYLISPRSSSYIFVFQPKTRFRLFRFGP